MAIQVPRSGDPGPSAPTRGPVIDAGRVRSRTARSLDRALVAIAGLSALIVVVEVAVLVRAPGPEGLATLAAPIGFAIYVVAGLIAWRRRPNNPMGSLMVWTGTTVLLAGIGSTGVPALEAIGAVCATLTLAAVIHLALAFPTGRLETAAARWTALAGYFVSLVLQIPYYLLDPAGSHPPFAVADAPGIVAAVDLVQPLAGAAVTIAAVVILAGRLRRADRIHRSMLVPLLAYSIFAVLFTPVLALFRATVGVDPLLGELLQFIVISGVPVAFVAGILRGGFPRSGDLNELGTWLGQAAVTEDRLSDVLARALGDPTLVLYHRSDEQGTFVDERGRPAPARDDPRRGWSDIAVDGAIVGVVNYDADLITDPTLVTAAGRVVAIAVERERLTADLQATKQAVLESREVLLAAAARDRRRVARERQVGQPADGRVGHVLTHLIADVDAVLDDLDRVAGPNEPTDGDLDLVVTGGPPGQDSRVGALTPRQREVLALVADGRSNASIAATLFLTEKAVVQHMSRIYGTLGLPPDAEAHRRVQAVVLYLSDR